MSSHERSSTRELLAAAAGGNEQAREQLLEVFRCRLKRVVAARLDSRVRRRIDESDVIQDAMVLAAQRLDSYIEHQPLNFYAWLRQNVLDKLHELHRFHRRQRRSIEREESIFLSDTLAAEIAQRVTLPGKNPFVQASKRETRRLVLSAINSLSYDDQALIALQYLEGLSLQESAEIMGLSHEAAKSRRRRALVRLAAQLSKLQEDSF